MAIQKGSIILEGRIGDLSFYRSNGKPQVRRHSDVHKGRIERDPRYARTRENNTEFGRASRAAKLIRVAVRKSLGARHELFEDATVVNRLTPRMSAIIKADTIHARGMRTVLPMHLPLLNGFGFNAVSALKDVLFVQPRYAYKRGAGLLTVTLPALYPHAAIAAPKGTALCSFHVLVVPFNTNYESLPFVAQESELLALGHQEIPTQTFPFELPEASNDPVLICFGISFFGLSGGYPIPMREQGRNALEVIGVDTDGTYDHPGISAVPDGD